MQGEGAAEEVAGALRAMSDPNGPVAVDAVILTRGGGSLEDLWAFNERTVADAIFRSAVPVVAAIGHETDTTIAELVADRRCSTPTQAAVQLVPDAGESHHRIGQLARRLSMTGRRELERQRARLDAIARHALFRQPTEAVDRQRRNLLSAQRAAAAAVRNRLHQLEHRLGASERRLARQEPATRLRLARHRLEIAAARLDRAVRQRMGGPDLAGVERRLVTATRTLVARKKQALDADERTLSAVDPKQVLNRGYTMTFSPDGRLIRSAEALSEGATLVTRFADGTVRSNVDGRAGDGSTHDGSEGSRKSTGRRGRDGKRSQEQPRTLFDP